MEKLDHKVLLNNVGGQQFEWFIPHVPDHPDIVVTLSRNQFSSQFDRLGVFPILSQARTAADFANVIKKVLFVKSKDTPSKNISTQFSRLLFDHKNSGGIQTSGCISPSNKKLFLRRLDGRLVKRKAGFTHGRFTRKQLEKLVKDNDINRTIFQIALQNFDKNKITIFLDAKGKRTKRLTKACSMNEVIYLDYRNPLEALRMAPTVTPTDMRMIFDQLFSFVGRGAGSRLAGSPLTILKESAQGVRTQNIRDFPNSITINYQYGDNTEAINNFALSPRKIVIGRPYVYDMQKASRLVTQAVDAVSRKLDEYIINQKLQGRKTVPVEEIAAYSLLNVNEWVLDSTLMNYHDSPSRTYQQMDFFLIPTVRTRSILIQEVKKHGGVLSDKAIKLLQKETQGGNLRLTIFDISGGGGGTGLSESVAKLAGYKTSGYMDAYIESLMAGYRARKGRQPKNIVLCPRKADLTLAAFEYIPFVERLRKQGIQAEIILSEQLEEALHHHDATKPFLVKTWDGKMIVPELIAKRFTFLGAGQEAEGDRGHIYTSLPEGVVILPSAVSRVPASDKRVNSAILEALRTQLTQIGIDVIPTITFSIAGKNSVEKVVKEIIKFGEMHSDEYPEIKFLGLILKVDDKRPGREGKGDELVSAYPIPAGIIQKTNTTDNQGEINNYIHSMLFHRINTLVDKGVLNIIIQPNLLTIFADGRDFMETKIIVYSKPK